MFLKAEKTDLMVLMEQTEKHKTGFGYVYCVRRKQHFLFSR